MMSVTHLRRAQLHLSYEQYGALAQIAEKRGISVSRLVRQILSDHLGQDPSHSGAAAVERDQSMGGPRWVHVPSRPAGEHHAVRQPPQKRQLQALDDIGGRRLVRFIDRWKDPLTSNLAELVQEAAAARPPRELGGPELRPEPDGDGASGEQMGPWPSSGPSLAPASEAPASEPPSAPPPSEAPPRRPPSRPPPRPPSQPPSAPLPASNPRTPPPAAVVVDASLVLEAVLPVDLEALALELIIGWRRDRVRICSPAVLVPECLSVLETLRRTERLSPAETKQALADVYALEVECIQPTVKAARAMLRWMEHLPDGHLRAAPYLSLAEEIPAPLWSSDAEITDLAEKLGIAGVHHVSHSPYATTPEGADEAEQPRIISVDPGGC